MSWPQSPPNMFPAALGGTATIVPSPVMNFGGGDSFMLRGNRRGGISPENEPAWVPLPGSKRSAPDNDIYLDRELGPAPPKQLAVDENYTNVVLARSPEREIEKSESERPWNGEWKQFRMTPDEGEVSISQEVASSSSFPTVDDEEMQEDIQEDLVPGANSNLEIVGDGKGIEDKWLHGGQVHVEGRKMHDNDSYSDIDSSESDDDSAGGGDDVVNRKYPKLILFEGLRDVLSKRRCEDFELPISLLPQMKRESEMAMVLWRPQTGPSNETDESTCARTTASNPKQNLSPKPKVESTESSNKTEEVMDLSV